MTCKYLILFLLTFLFSEWINQVKIIMKMYVEKTEGSFVEVKESIIIWNYKHAEYDFGKL